ncbi:MAG: hypothetical protein J7502_04835 [Flavisolibacter sp.]|nr:hypothetical protein [Flavisolibacter sp.]
MKTNIRIVILFFYFIPFSLFAQPPLVYSKENTGTHFAIPPLRDLDQLPVIDPLPDPFMWSNGKGRSTKFSDWEKRRNEIKAEIEHYEIGKKPNKPENVTASYSKSDSTLKVDVTVNGQTLTLTSKIILPSGNGPFPAVIGMNSPNGSIPADIFFTRNIARIRYAHNQVTTYNGPKNTDPYYKLYPELWGVSGQYSAWAWGVSRIIDGLELVQDVLPIDLKHLAVTGCSYAGKMALFSGAFDERIALTIAQESGGGGATAWRVSETIGDVEKLGATSHQWFMESMFQFSGLNVSRLPHDHHELMAMVAPRALLVTGNTDYMWLANPSNYVVSRATKEIYKTLGISDRFGFYIDGKHGHCAIPTNQRPAIEAFVDKFMLGKTNVNTDTVTVHPYPEIDYKSWYSWWGKGKPAFPNEGNIVKIWLEAECGAMGSGWKIVTDATASNEKYVVNDSNSTRAVPKDSATNSVVISFTVPRAGSYNVLGKVNGDRAHDSYYVKVDNAPYVNANNAFGGVGWQWGRLTSANLSAGQHTLTITYREGGAKLDKILITNSNASTVVSSESRGMNCDVN